MEFELAPSSRAKYLVSDDSTSKGEFRYGYRIKDSSSERDRKKVHLRCASLMPVKNRAYDLEQILCLLEKTSLSVDAVASFNVVQNVLQSCLT